MAKRRRSRGKSPPRRKRDYRLEYALRKQKAQLLGYSLDIARGHTPKGLLSVKQAKSLSTRERIVLPGTRVEDVPKEAITTDRVAISQALHDRQQEILDSVYGIDIRNVHGVDFFEEEELMRYLLDNGFTAREAFELRFSPKE